MYLLPPVRMSLLNVPDRFVCPLSRRSLTQIAGPSLNHEFHHLNSKSLPFTTDLEVAHLSEEVLSVDSGVSKNLQVGLHAKDEGVHGTEKAANMHAEDIVDKGT